MSQIKVNKEKNSVADGASSPLNALETCEYCDSRNLVICAECFKKPGNRAAKRSEEAKQLFAENESLREQAQGMAAEIRRAQRAEDFAKSDLKRLRDKMVTKTEEDELQFIKLDLSEMERAVVDAVIEWKRGFGHEGSAAAFRKMSRAASNLISIRDSKEECSNCKGSGWVDGDDCQQCNGGGVAQKPPSYTEHPAYPRND